MASLIYVHPESKGSLYQGGKSDVEAIELESYHYDLVVLSASTYQPKHISLRGGPSSQPLTVMRIPFDDTTGFSHVDRQIIKNMVEGAATMAAQFIKQGKRVLISCRAGHNRSGLVSAYTLKRLEPRFMQNPVEVVDLIKAKRGPEALSNHEFVDMIIDGF